MNGLKSGKRPRGVFKPVRDYRTLKEEIADKFL